jgi:hypothetical protein
MPQSHTKTQSSQDGASTTWKPSEQALEVVDVTFGAVPRVAETVRTKVEQWRKPETRSEEIETLQKRVSTLRDPKTRNGEIESLRQRFTDEVERVKVDGTSNRRKVTDQVVEQARKARERVEPVYKKRFEPIVRERVEPVYKKRFEPVVRERVQPVYRERVEPTVRRVRERI